MKRRLWFLALFAPQVQGQEIVATCYNPPPSKLCKPENNVCPVCFTKADPFKKRPDKAYVCQTVIDPKEGPTGSYECPKPDTNLTRCAHCSNAFFQDAV